MKKVSILSGGLLFALVILLLTGTINLNDNVKQSINKGNQLFELEKYDEALTTYQKGLDREPDNDCLNYNAAQTAYCLKDYQQATQYYTKSSSDLNKYIHLGNANLKLGDGVEDDNQKLQYYQQAVETYKNGIQYAPQNVEIKYNYEIAKNKLDE